MAVVNSPGTFSIFLNAAKVFLNWIASRDGLTQLQKLARENSLRVDIAKEGIVNPYSILDAKRESIFTGLEEHNDKIANFVRRTLA